jgi:hypothetical protein
MQPVKNFKNARGFRVALEKSITWGEVGRSPEFYGAVNEQALTVMRRPLAHTDKPALSERAAPPRATLEASICRSSGPCFHDVTLCQADRRQRLEVIVGLSR